MLDEFLGDGGKGRKRQVLRGVKGGGLIFGTADSEV